MEIELKNCPCCGGDAEIQSSYTPPKRIEKFPNREHEYRIVCADDYDLMTDWYPTPEAAAEAWNRREGEDKLKAEVEELKVSYANALYSHKHECQFCKEDYKIFVDKYPEYDMEASDGQDK